MTDERKKIKGLGPAIAFEQRSCGSRAPIRRTVRLGKEIGSGSVGIVVSGTLDEGGREVPVAVKVLRKELAGTLAGERFAREAELMCSLTHPNLVRGIGCGSIRLGQGDPPLPFLVMELVKGPTLGDAILRKAFFADPAGAAGVVLGISNALGYLHLEGRVQAHRDIKPANILLAPDGTAKLADLGVAKAFACGPARHGGTQLTGTVAYMAPEQMADSSRVDVRSDIYSLGLVLAEMLGIGIGRSPLERIRNGAAPSPSREDARRLGLARREATMLASLMGRMLANDPSDRFQTPAELSRELASLLKALEEGSGKAAAADKRKRPGGSRWRIKGRPKKAAVIAACALAAAIVLMLGAISPPLSDNDGGTPSRPQPPQGSEIVVDRP